MINFHIDWLLICINISIDEKFKQIRQFDSIYDWTSQRDDSILKEHIKDYIEISKYLQEECKKYNLTFIDVSKDRENKLRDIANKILKI